jgi:hypothetical protein
MLDAHSPTALVHVDHDDQLVARRQLEVGDLIKDFLERFGGPGKLD